MDNPDAFPSFLFPPCCPSPSPLRLDGEETQVWTRGQLMEKEEAKRRASYFRPYRVQLSSVDARPHRYAHTQPLGKRGELGAAGWAGVLVGGVGAEGTVEWMRCDRGQVLTVGLMYVM